MSCLKLRIKKLPSARKAWKSFASKIQTKLHRLHTPATTIRKPSSRLATAAALWPLGSLPPTPPYYRRKSRFLPPPLPPPQSQLQTPSLALALHRRRCRSRLLRKKRKLVYVDDLFKEPATKVAAAEHRLMAPPPEGKAVVLAPVSAAERVSGKESVAADEMDGIDERAEEFIARFRAEMELQERLVRGLL